MMIRVVIDTNVIISAMLAPRSVPGRMLGHFKAQMFEWLISAEILQEYAFALSYEKVRQRHKLSDAQLVQFLDDLRLATILVQPSSALRVVDGDPDDNKLFKCALAGGAHFIVSGDLAVQQVQNYQGVQVLSPAMFLAMLEQSKA